VFDIFLRKVSHHLVGISISGQPTVKVLAFADDIVFAAADSNDIKAFISSFSEFSSNSQAKINTQKTEILKLGYESISLPWSTLPSTEVKHLGYPLISTGIAKTHMENTLLTKASSKISGWNMRDVSLIGRIHLVNTFIVSKTNYAASAFPFSSSFITRFNSMIQRFIWNTQYPPAPISRCYGPKSSGGLGLINLQEHADRIYGKSLLQILIPPNSSNNWYRAAQINFSRALNLPSPLLKHTLNNFISSHPGTPGPHHLSRDWKDIFSVMLRNSWTVNFEYPPPQRGTPIKTPVIYCKNKKINDHSDLSSSDGDPITPRLTSILLLD